jgi:putative restriction endonuclease
MIEPAALIEKLAPAHRVALRWFRGHQGQEVAWLGPLPSGMFLVNRAKGIHKPRGLPYALSIWQVLHGPCGFRCVEQGTVSG